MNIHALRIFTEVVKTGGVTNAATEINISQPAVTIQIRNLEKELGVKLFTQKGRNLKLTKEGDFLYVESQRFFQHEADLAEKFTQFKQGQKILKIAASYISANYILPKVIAQFKQHFPETNFKLKLSNVHSVQQRVLNFEADVGVVVQNEEKIEGLHFDKLMTIPFDFIVHPSHPLANSKITLDMLQSFDFIYREKSSSIYDLFEAIFLANNVPLPKKGIQVEGVEESIKIVEAGYGILLAPKIAIEDKIKKGILARIDVKNMTIEQSLYICTRVGELENDFIHYLKLDLAKMG